MIHVLSVLVLLVGLDVVAYDALPLVVVAAFGLTITVALDLAPD